MGPLVSKPNASRTSAGAAVRTAVLALSGFHRYGALVKFRLGSLAARPTAHVARTGLPRRSLTEGRVAGLVAVSAWPPRSLLIHCFRAPVAGQIRQAAIPPAAYRDRHSRTVGTLSPARSATSVCGSPPAASSRIRARLASPASPPEAPSGAALPRPQPAIPAGQQRACPLSQTLPRQRHRVPDPDRALGRNRVEAGVEPKRWRLSSTNVWAVGTYRVNDASDSTATETLALHCC